MNDQEQVTWALEQADLGEPLGLVAERAMVILAAEVRALRAVESGHQDSPGGFWEQRRIEDRDLVQERLAERNRRASEDWDRGITSQTIADAAVDTLRRALNEVLVTHAPIQNEGTPIPICMAGCTDWPCVTYVRLERTLGGGR